MVVVRLGGRTHGRRVIGGKTHKIDKHGDIHQTTQLAALGFKSWSGDLWNIIDFLISFTYFASLFFRVIAWETQWGSDTSKMIISIDAMFVYIRVIHYYAISEDLGPMVMIACMAHH